MGLIGKGLGKILGILLGTAAVAGTAAAIKGASDSKKAKQINNEAKQIQSQAIARYDESFKSVNLELIDLGKEKKYAIDLFSRFSDLFSRIQDPPEFNGKYDSKYEIAHVDISEVDYISDNIRMFFAGAAGAGAGALIGLAAFGVSAVLAAPAIAVGGFAIGVKGNKLKQEALHNREKAIELDNKIDSIVKYHLSVENCAYSMTASFKRANSLYYRYLLRLDGVLKWKQNWNTFNRYEKMIVGNCVLLTELLTEMCKLEIVLKGSGSSERVNTEGIRDLEDKIYTALPDFANALN